MIIKPNNRAIGPWLKQLREERGILQEEVARKMGTTQSAVSRLEGQINPGWLTITTYIAALGLTPSLAANPKEGAQVGNKSRTRHQSSPDRSQLS